MVFTVNIIVVIKVFNNRDEVTINNNHNCSPGNINYD